LNIVTVLLYSNQHMPDINKLTLYTKYPKGQESGK